MVDASGSKVRTIATNWGRSTQGGGACPPKAAHIFEAALDDLAHDHRVGTAALRGRRFGVLGCGATAYEPAVFCTAAKRCERALRKLGASRVASAALDDCDGARDAAYGAWEARVCAESNHRFGWS